ncbi:MAG: hypothetical protein IPJ34_10390 [Myxococcales bacterium]|nr:hypothetical protein [Myxococcales bacterium]
MISVPPPSREVRLDHWERRSFYAAACRFFIDVPLDMSGIVLAGQREALHAGFKLKPAAAAYATDSIYRGAVLLELDGDPGIDGSHIVRLEGEVLVRALPPKGAKLRAELNELARWSKDLGYEVNGLFVVYESNGTMPGGMKATQVFAPVKSAP